MTVQYLPAILLVFHLLYENSKLKIDGNDLRSKLGVFLLHISKIIKWTSYEFYYMSEGYVFHGDCYINCKANKLVTFTSPSELVTNPPNIMQWISERLRTREPKKGFPLPNDIPGFFDIVTAPIHGQEELCRSTMHIVKVVNAMISSKISGAESAVFEMIACGMKSRELDVLPYGLSVPLREAIHSCRVNPNPNWDEKMLYFIGREDIARQRTYWFSSLRPLPLKHVLDSEDVGSMYDMASRTAAVKEITGVELENDELIKLRFFEDDRISLVQSLLQTTRPAQIDFIVTPNMTNDAHVVEQQRLLNALSNRTLASPLGRGLFTCSSAASIPPQSVFVPELIVSANMPPLNQQVVLDTSKFPADATEWPQFHNGVASGLKFPFDAKEISNSWIHQMQKEMNATVYAGLIFGLGLNGHLRNFESWRVPQIMNSHEMTGIGVMLGLASSHVGVNNPHVTNVAAVHIPSLSSNVNPKFSSLIHSASLIALGLNFMGLPHRKYIELLLDEIWSRNYLYDESFTSGDASKNVEGHSVAAGIALGMITVGLGDKLDEFEDLNIVDELSRFVHGARSTGRQTGAFSKRIKQPIDLNAGATSPGATIALGLMFLKTNNPSIAAKLSLPVTKQLLDYSRPDFLMLRTLSRSLVLWDTIEACERWMDGLIPQYVKTDLRDGDRWNASNIGANVIKGESVRHALYNILAGGCLSIGIRFAGSLNPTVLRLLIRYLDYFDAEVRGIPNVHVKSHQHEGVSTFEGKLNRSVARCCFDVVLTAAAAVMAGSGNLELLYRYKAVHDQFEDTLYGSQMACQMAIGMLFLGGGTLTLGTTNTAIVGLVCALFPRYPTNTMDNRSHLQALRHFWVLAVEYRCLVPRDIHDQSACLLPIQVVVEGSADAINIMAPCILPAFSSIRLIKVCSPRYWPVKINVRGNRDQFEMLMKTRTLAVKRKAGYLNYMRDPRGNRGIRSRSFPLWLQSVSGATQTRPPESKAEEELALFFVQAFSLDPYILAVSEHFCRRNLSNDDLAQQMASFATAVIYDCLIDSKCEMVETYLELYRATRDLWWQPAASVMWNWRLLQQFYEHIEDALGQVGERNSYVDFVACRSTIQTWFELQEGRGTAFSDNLDYERRMHRGEIARGWMVVRRPLIQRAFVSTAASKFDEMFRRTMLAVAHVGSLTNGASLCFAPSPRRPRVATESLLERYYGRSGETIDSGDFRILSAFLTFYALPAPHLLVDACLAFLKDSPAKVARYRRQWQEKHARRMEEASALGRRAVMAFVEGMVQPRDAELWLIHQYPRLNPGICAKLSEVLMNKL
ncbi:Anaphase-promoting complex subunit 1 [Irineochytrium annulatum]|nr:Anaphase-promoting complex subunit 1 [Irineochytrium annulatum]